MQNNIPEDQEQSPFSVLASIMCSKEPDPREQREKAVQQLASKIYCQAVANLCGRGHVHPPAQCELLALDVFKSAEAFLKVGAARWDELQAILSAEEEKDE